MNSVSNSSALLRDRLWQSLGEIACIVEPAEMQPYLTDWRGLYNGKALMVVRPKTTSEVAEVVRQCSGLGIAVVPQAGNTSLVGGSVPLDSGDSIVLSLGRLNKIREIDVLDHSITADAGCVLSDIQSAAAGVDLLFPLSLGAEGSCQIGGNIATNAGGVHVMRYGNCRDLVLGLEVVMPDGTVWDGLRKLRKDNTGYDLKQLFIGSEGTLGVITGAVLKLFPTPREQITCLVAFPDASGALELLAFLRSDSGECVSAFELIPRMGIDLALKHVSGVRDPLGEKYEHYALIEMSSSRADAGLSDLLQTRLEHALDSELVLDAVVASSEVQAKQLWRLREGMVEAQAAEGSQIKHDISVPVGQIPRFLDRAGAMLTEVCPGVRIMAFGHVGDGNVHFNLSPPLGMQPQEFVAMAGQLTGAVYATAIELGGSISAEHGVGQLKRDQISGYKPAVEIEAMRRIKRALDPEAIMNPGKVVRSE